MRAIVLMVCDEDGEGLGGGCAGVVGAFCCLNCGGNFRCCLSSMLEFSCRSPRSRW